MDIFTSVLNICSTVNDTDRQYRILSQKLNYQIRKAQHLLQNQRIKTVPKFMIDNLKIKVLEAKTYLQKIDNLLKEDRISFKEKIKLSLPFNKTNMEVKNSLEELQKAQQDVSEYAGSSEVQPNGKRSIGDDMKKYQYSSSQDLQKNESKFQKKQQTMMSNVRDSQVDDQDINEVMMGPTIEEDVAIEFTKNKYIQIHVQLNGSKQLIDKIRQVDEKFLNIRKKILIKFGNNQKNQPEQLELFSLGRLYFKPIYSKIKPIFPDIDKISKQTHFVIVLRRLRQAPKQQQKKTPNKQQKPQNTSQGDEFFSFPVTQQQVVLKQTQSIILKRSSQKNVLYRIDPTGGWKKMQQIQGYIFSGQQIAPTIQLNKYPILPQLTFKVRFQMTD